jgi:hypothetical protein
MLQKMLPIRFAATLLFTLPILAADAPLPDLHTDPAPAGSILTVKNNYSQPLDAFVIELVAYPGSTFSLVHDEMGADAIAAGAEKKINVTNMTVGAVPEHVKLLAAVYEDGATAGAADKIKEILDRRKAKLETTREIIQRIEKAQAAGKDKDAIVAELREWSNSMAPPRGLRPAPADLPKIATRTLIGVAASHINTQGVAPELANLKKTESELAASKPPL